MPNNKQNTEKIAERGGQSANYCYAVETLEIELNRIKMTLRQINSNIHECMTDIPERNLYLDRQKELENAIAVLSV